MYRVFRTSLGVVDAINRLSDGSSLPYNAQSKTFNESHPLTIELRQWEQDRGTPLDLSDHPPDVVPPPEPNWSELLNNIRDSGLITRFYASAKENLGANASFTLLINCLVGLYDVASLELALTDLQVYIQPVFSEGEIDFLNQSLSTNDFPFQLTYNG